jgi:hypothetical protein
MYSRFGFFANPVCLPHTAVYQPDCSNLIGRWKIVKEATELQSTNRLFSTESPTRLIQWEVHQRFAIALCGSNTRSTLS